MNKVNPHSTGLVLGAFLALIHLVWSFLVLIGMAQPLLNFIFKLHMMSPVLAISGFTYKRAIGLIIITAVIGYVFGWLLGVIWNKYASK